jgi:hypothetical protein
MSDNPVQVAVARLAAALRRDRPMDPVVIANARNDLVAVKTERAIRYALDPGEPYEPLREEDRVRLANLLRVGKDLP